ncbi:MAG TPA: phage portal protein [Noviherbaspirillum sp.]|jgi:HK97 family phage portal protein|uniref:phage portal protein n=1 Tax=Noviherbaspirillum sp. TaxID=1926288 RepID=UPI002F93AEF9
MSETKQKSPGRLKSSVLKWLGVPIELTNGAFWSSWLGSKSWSGKTVTVDAALQLSTVWACVRLIAETLSTLPINFYERSPDGARKVAVDHPLYEILHNQPNADMTAVVFWEAVICSMLLWGNAFCEIVRVGNRIIALDFLMPDSVSVRRRTDGSIEYRYRGLDGKAREIPEGDMMHIPAFTTNGMIGLSPVQYGANVFGTAIATDQASAETFKDAMRSPGLVTMDSVLQPKQREDIRQHVNKVSKEGGVMVLEKGAGFQQLSFKPADAELLGSRAFNIEEMCRWFRVDPVLIGHGEKQSNWGTGVEQKMLGFLMLTLRTWCVRIEQGIRKSLLTPVERRKYFAEFAIEGLLRADTAARAAFYSIMVQNGLMTRDEVRRLENLPPKGGNSAVLTVQSNMLPIDKLGEHTDAGAAKAALLHWLSQDDPKGPSNET